MHETAAVLRVPRLAAIWRYPVKSLQGEQLSEAVVDDDGLRGDRWWGVRDQTTGRILTGRREPRLLLASASVTDDGEPQITLPNGDRCLGIGPATDAALSGWLGRSVTLSDARGAPGASAEFFQDATDDASPALEWTMPAGRFVDAMPLLLLTTASIRTALELHPDGNWDVRRFRSNLLVDSDADGWVEDGWCGNTVRVGPVELVPSQPCVRCTMVTRPQPGLERDLDIFRTIARSHGGTLGVWAGVSKPGTLRIGEPVDVNP